MKVVLPGDKIADKPLAMENAVVENGKTYATVIGMLDDTGQSFVPLETVWYPREGDFVIGIVEMAKNNVYTLNLSSPFRGLILPPKRSFGGRGRNFGRDRDFGRDRESGPGRNFGRDRGFGRDGGFEDRPEPMQIGDIATAFVKEVKRESDQIIMILERSRKLSGGKLITVRPSKVPRIIGRTNTMLHELEQGTKSQILVGLNGVVWINGGNITLAMKAIDKIQEEAHISGLTERVKELLGSGNAKGD